MTADEIVQRLKETGCKLTPQRRMLVEVMLAKGGSEVTADDVYQEIRATYPEMGLDTVYRNLRLLAKLNIVNEVKLPGKQVHFSVNLQVHQHGLVCLECGREVPLGRCPIKELEAVALEEHGFVISSHRIELFGYCPECKATHQNRGG